jgi:hypothetical protein
MLFFENSCVIYRGIERFKLHRKLEVVDSGSAGDLLMQDRETVSVRCCIIHEVGGEDGASSPEGEDA